jgi:hypothetical protein
MRRKRTPDRRRTAGRIAVAAAAVLGWAVGSNAQSGQDYLPQATIVEVMNAMVMPFAEDVWEAVVYEETIKGPATEEGWQQARNAAVALAESANVLMIPERPVAGPDKVAGEGELSPQEIGDLIAKSRGAWTGYAQSLHEVAMQAIKAIDARDPEKLSDVGGAMDSVCQGCHVQFWYPNQQ